MPKPPLHPPGLGKRGRKLWREVLATRPQLSPGEHVILEEACRLTDRAEMLNDQILGGSLLEYVPNDTGTVVKVVVSAPLSEARLTVLAIRKALEQLGLDKRAAADLSEKGATGDPVDEIARRRAGRETGT